MGRFRGMLLALVAASLLIACAPRRDNAYLRLSPPVESTTVGPGDVFNMEIVGETESREYQVGSDGTVALPYIHRVKVEGLEPRQIEELVRQKLIHKQILQDPSVIVTIEEYNSKRVTVLGQVQKPDSFPLTPGLTLIQALSLAGGMNSIADKGRVNLTRRTRTGSRTVSISVEAITDGRSPDIPLQAGDRIYVQERIY
jgi:protein involved in polysaccharide export with SLBB domain